MGTHDRWFRKVVSLTKGQTSPPPSLLYHNVFESVNTLQKIFYFIKRLPKGAWNPANAGFFYALMPEKNVERIF